MTELAAGDAAWLLVLLDNAVPRDPGSNMDWEGKGREYARSLLEPIAQGSKPAK